MGEFKVGLHSAKLTTVLALSLAMFLVDKHWCHRSPKSLLSGLFCGWPESLQVNKILCHPSRNGGAATCMFRIVHSTMVDYSVLHAIFVPKVHYFQPSRPQFWSKCHLKMHWTLSVLKHLGKPPVITEHPSDAVVEKNSPAELTCRASGFPEPKISWYRNGVEIPTERRRSLLPNGNLYFIRTVSSKRKTDNGIYSCKAKNRFGTVYSKNASLFIGSEWFLSNHKYIIIIIIIIIMMMTMTSTMMMMM